MEHGKVTTVEYKDGVTYCNVRAIRVNTEYTGVPVMKPHSGFIQMPEQGDTVTMETLDDGTRFISSILGKVENTPESMKEGEFTIQLDGGTRVSFEEQSDGTYDLHLDASGDVYINGTKQ